MIKRANKTWSTLGRQGPVVRRVDNFILQINPYPADKIDSFLSLIGERANFIPWIGFYPLDKDVHSPYKRAQAG